MKKNINITIDEELYNLVKDSGKPMSTTINEMLGRSFTPQDSTEAEDKLIEAELTLAREYNLDEREFFLLKENYNKNIVSFWKYNKINFTNIKNIYELIEVKKAFAPLWFDKNLSKKEVEE
ncbi:MAG TPA: hypothetical protein VMV32_12320 [Ignavibacteriaceae bacterium]|nr:hypothetical protein [Ignavibacteriaceae bacterium]